MYKRVRNLVDEVHKKLSKWLCENYRVVLLPKFDMQQMTRRAKRKINSTTARGMYTWAHYRFRQTLIHKAELYPSCTVIVCDERYTSMTCGLAVDCTRHWGARRHLGVLILTVTMLPTETSLLHETFFCVI